MTSEDFKLVVVFSMTCAAWYLVGYLTGLMVTCDVAFAEGMEEGITEASTPTDQ